MDIMELKESKELKLNDIRIDENLNVRELLDEDTITRYMECFEQLPPIVVFETDDGYLLADGFHRYEVAKRLEREAIDAEVKLGGYDDAKEYAAIANLKHGKPLTRAERGKAVEVMLKLHTERSDSWIADDMGVSKNTVAKYREELESGCQIDRLNKLIGRDGKEYPREIKQPRKDEQTSDEQVDEQPRETMQEVPDEQPKVAEVEATSEEQTQAEAVQVVGPQAEDTVEAQAEEIQLHCDERFLSLDDIEKYVGKKVKVTISAGRGGGNAQLLGTILDIDEQDEKFILDFETEDGEKRQIQTGTTTDKTTDVGIIEIVELHFEDIEPSAEPPKVDEVTETPLDHIDDEAPEATVDEGETDRSGNPEEWDMFNEYYHWIKDYSFKLASLDDVSSVHRIHMVLKNLTQQLGEALEELEETL